MNELTKFLIKELLDEQKTVAIYGGGFKPPTKGHFTVAKQVINDKKAAAKEKIMKLK